MDDEPLSRWVERRDAKIGRLRSMPIVAGEGPKGAHLNPDAPRAVEQWNGHAWEPYAVVANLAEAKQVMYPETVGTDPTAVQPSDTKPLDSGAGKHRKPHLPRSDSR